MLIKIQNIEEECSYLEDEVEELRRKINRMLKDEKQDKEKARELHELEKEGYRSGNLLQMTDLKTFLLTIK